MSLKRNQFLDVRISDEEGASHSESDDAQEARESKVSGLTARSSKRRKLSPAGNESAEDAASQDSEDDSEAVTNPQSPAPLQTYTTTEPADTVEAPSKPPTSKKLKPLNPAQLAASQKAARKTGVIYLSSIPPFMRPSIVRHLLSPYGTITRLFLTPEPPSTYASRLKSGGNKKRSFIDGWVEFTRKRDAKMCVKNINGQIIGGKKGGWYHDDLWNVKYLKGFKWGDLMEGVRNEERAREERLRVEIRREGKERKAFLEGVEQGKKEVGMERKRKKQREGKGEVDGVEKGAAVGEEGGAKKEKRVFERRFRQNEVKKRSKPVAGDGDGDGDSDGQPDDVSRVLSKIF